MKTDETNAEDSAAPRCSAVTLLPCPFCGDVAEYFYDHCDYGTEHYVQCCQCFAEVNTSSKATAIANWNQRTE